MVLLQVLFTIQIVTKEENYQILPSILFCFDAEIGMFIS